MKSEFYLHLGDEGKVQVQNPDGISAGGDVSHAHWNIPNRDSNLQRLLQAAVAACFWSMFVWVLLTCRGLGALRHRGTVTKDPGKDITPNP